MVVLVLLSWDGGRFVEVLDVSQGASSVAWAPSNPDVAYALAWTASSTARSTGVRPGCAPRAHTPGSERARKPERPSRLETMRARADHVSRRYAHDLRRASALGGLSMMIAGVVATVDTLMVGSIGVASATLLVVGGGVVATLRVRSGPVVSRVTLPPWALPSQWGSHRNASRV